MGCAAGVVSVGPYRWVRNPIYLAALIVVLGEAWLFLSLPLMVYAGAMAIAFHLFVIGYEERTLPSALRRCLPRVRGGGPALDPAQAPAGMSRTAPSEPASRSPPAGAYGLDSPVSVKLAGVRGVGS